MVGRGGFEFGGAGWREGSAAGLALLVVSGRRKEGASRENGVGRGGYDLGKWCRNLFTSEPPTHASAQGREERRNRER